MGNVSYNAMSEARALDIHVQIYFKAVNFSSRKYRISSSFLNGGDAPTAVVDPTNIYLLSSLNTDTFRLLRLRDVTDTSYR